MAQMVEVDRVGDRWAILTQNFWGKRRGKYKNGRERGLGFSGARCVKKLSSETIRDTEKLGDEGWGVSVGMGASPVTMEDRSRRTHSFLAERCSERPEAVKGARVGRGEANP